MTCIPISAFNLTGWVVFVFVLGFSIGLRWALRRMGSFKEQITESYRREMALSAEVHRTTLALIDANAKLRQLQQS